MALQGTIDAFPVVDVLHLLAGSRKTGRLIVEGDRSTAQLFVLDGAMTGGGVQGIGEAQLADVVAELLRYSEGSFLFEPGTLAPAPQEPGDLVSLVEAARARLAEWASIEAVGPSMSRRVALVPEIGADGVQLSAQEWSLVVAAGEHAKIGEVVAAAGVADITTCSMIAALVERGLVVVDAPTAEIVLADVPADLAASSSPDEDLDDGPDVAADAAAGSAPEVEVSGDTVIDDDTAYEVVLLDDDASADGTFPEHFPIDDLIGVDETEGSWDHTEVAGADDRLAAAQTFDGDGSPSAFTGGGFSSGGFSGGSGDLAGETGAADGFERFDPGGLFGAGPSTFEEPAAQHATNAAAASHDEPAFDPGALFGAQPTSESSVFDSGAFDPQPDHAPAGFGGGFTDMGAFTDPVGASSGGSEAMAGSAPKLNATFIGDGAFTDAPTRAPIAVQDPVADTAADSAADEVLRQMSKLSPKAAEAIAAALGSAADSDGSR